MLVLARKSGESLQIDGSIRVTILSIEGDRVRVGIEAPRSIAVVRQEILEAISVENRQAVVGQADESMLRRIGKCLKAAPPVTSVDRVADEASSPPLNGIQHP